MWVCQTGVGNSEVGHLNLGAGRVVYQELQRINVAIRSGEFSGTNLFYMLFVLPDKIIKPYTLLAW